MCTLGEMHGDLLSLKSIHVPWKAMSDGCALIVHTLFYSPATAGCNALARWSPLHWLEAVHRGSGYEITPFLQTKVHTGNCV